MQTIKPEPSTKHAAWSIRNREKVKSYVRPKRGIGEHICPGCLRERIGCYHKVFCDHFCEELWRKDRERRETQDIPWDSTRKSFFLTGTKGDGGSLLVPISSPTYPYDCNGRVAIKINSETYERCQ